MKAETEQVLCRFHLSNFAGHRDEPFYQWIVETARREGLQGATVLKGIAGLRPGGAVLAESPWKLAQEVPVIVEVIDTAPRIEALLATIEPVFPEGAITLERAHVVVYRAGSGPDGTTAEGMTEGTTDATADGTTVTGSKDASAAPEVRTMKLPEEGVLLRIFIGEADREPGRDRPLYRALVQRAREAHLAGATVLKGPLGFGKHSRVHSAKLLELSSDLPIVIEIVDTEEKIRAFLPVVDALVTEGLVTLEAVRVLKYAAAGS